MLDDEALAPLLAQLVGEAETKPFECVGTIGEVRTALQMALRRWYADRRPTLLRDYRPTALPEVRLDTLAPDHNLSESELTLLRNHVQTAAF